MSERTLSAKLRTEDFGTSGSRRLLRAGRIPAVVYGKNAPVHVSLDAREFINNKKYFGPTTLILLNVDGEEHEVFVKTYQEDLLRGNIRHVDFFEVTRGQLLRTHVGIVLEGTPAGVREGGVLEQVLHEVEIECLPKNLPEHIVVNVEGIGLNEQLTVAQLPVSEGVTIHTHADETVAVVKTVKEEVAEPAEDADATAEAAAPAADAE